MENPANDTVQAGGAERGFSPAPNIREEIIEIPAYSDSDSDPGTLFDPLHPFGYPNRQYLEESDGGGDDMAERPTTPRQGANQMVNGAGPPLVVSSSLPHAGYQQDLNYVYSLLGELSDQLRENRDQTQTIREGVARIQLRATETGEQPTLQEVNTELNGSPNNPRATIAQLEAQIDTITTQRDKAMRNVTEMNEVNELYQDTMTTMMDKIRNFIYDREMEVIAIHRKYNNDLQALKDENLEIRLEHSRWQEGLGRAMHYARLALRAVSQDQEYFEAERAELREENRMLRWQLDFERRYDDQAPEDDEEGGVTGDEALARNDEHPVEHGAPTL